MKAVASVFGAVLIWTNIIYLLVETVRMGNRNPPRGRYFIYEGLFLGSPFLGVVMAWLASWVIGDSMGVVVGITSGTVALCWGFGIYLLLKWQRQDREMSS